MFEDSIRQRIDSRSFLFQSKYPGNGSHFPCRIGTGAKYPSHNWTSFFHFLVKFCHPLVEIGLTVWSDRAEGCFHWRRRFFRRAEGCLHRRRRFFRRARQLRRYSSSWRSFSHLWYEIRTMSSFDVQTVVTLTFSNQELVVIALGSGAPVIGGLDVGHNHSSGNPAYSPNTKRAEKNPIQAFRHMFGNTGAAKLEKTEVKHEKALEVSLFISFNPRNWVQNFLSDSPTFFLFNTWLSFLLFSNFLSIHQSLWLEISRILSTNIPLWGFDLRSMNLLPFIFDC